MYYSIKSLLTLTFRFSATREKINRDFREKETEFAVINMMTACVFDMGY